MKKREYGASGWVGIGVPQANPTIEMEMRRFLPSDVEPLTTRLTSSSDSSDERLIEYIERLPDYLRAFDVLPLDAFGLACTGSSYLVGAKREADILASVSATFGYPMITAAIAIREALASIKANRVALLAPYPQHLIDAGVQYWEASGLEVVAVQRMDLGSADTREIYGLQSSDALSALKSFDPGNADAILMSGTGMPSLSASS
ncbi:MAG: maleate cis-trans isomerase family protein [Alphaproteobacteria bacterium]